MSAKTESTSRPGLSTILKNKIGKFNKRITSSRSKSSPALIIADPLVTIVNNKPLTKHIAIPDCSRVIDLSLIKGKELNKAVQELITELFHDWVSKESLHSDLKMERVSGAMTNAVFFVTVGKKRMLLRVYGVGCDQILDRNKELDWLSRLSQLHIGPKLLGTFGNGRFEEYLPSTTLTRSEIRESNISIDIASRLYQLHSIVDTFPPTNTDTLEVWSNVDKWFNSLSTDIIPKLLLNDSNLQDKIQIHFDLEKLRNEIQLCKNILGKVHSPIVFAHNDLQYGNILKINGTNELVVIDFEYAGYNPRGFDIVNHFCEWMYDYHCDTPSTMFEKNYPTEKEQRLFLTSYLNDTQEDVDSLLKEVQQWKMACHLFWGLWGLIQASQSQIDFDYFHYSIQRITAFRHDLKNHL